MGQGTDSCGGHDAEYDPYEEGLFDGMWTQRDGTKISVTAMTTSHLRGARRVAENAAICATFSSDEDQWNEWVEVFERELERRGEEIKPNAKYVSPSAINPTHGEKTVMVCHCGTEYPARKADIDRGWGLSCSKRCASIRREYNKPAAKKKEYSQ
ncbi:hypothetical protein D3C85_377460 [compost metagenome]